MKLKRFFPSLFLILFVHSISKCKTRISPYIKGINKVLKSKRKKRLKMLYRSVRIKTPKTASKLKPIIKPIHKG